MMDWSATQYLRFEDERTRPARNLLDAVPNLAPADVIDLGCGPGNSTRLLTDKYPAATVTGLDSSPDMLEQARRELPDVRFELGNIQDWRPARAYDVIFANAVLQWLPNLDALLPRLVSHLKPGGTLAVQMPDNLDEPSHRSIYEVAGSRDWSARLGPANATRSTILSPSEFYSALASLCSRIDVWRTVYNHPMDSAEAIVEWFKGSALRPYLAVLDAQEKRAFLEEYTRLIAERYPRQPDGKALLAFPRTFIVATR